MTFEILKYLRRRPPKSFRCRNKTPFCRLGESYSGETLYFEILIKNDKSRAMFITGDDLSPLPSMYYQFGT